jgi:hypothetical protein
MEVQVLPQITRDHDIPVIVLNVGVRAGADDDA